MNRMENKNLMFLPLSINHYYVAQFISQLLELGDIYEILTNLIVGKNSLFNSHLFYYETEHFMFINYLYFLSCELSSHDHFKY